MGTDIDVCRISVLGFQNIFTSVILLRSETYRRRRTDAEEIVARNNGLIHVGRYEVLLRGRLEDIDAVKVLLAIVVGANNPVAVHSDLWLGLVGQSLDLPSFSNFFSLFFRNDTYLDVDRVVGIIVARVPCSPHVSGDMGGHLDPRLAQILRDPELIGAHELRGSGGRVAAIINADRGNPGWLEGMEGPAST